jgi:hypothetical protein
MLAKGTVIVGKVGCADDYTNHSMLQRFNENEQIVEMRDFSNKK